MSKEKHQAAIDYLYGWMKGLEHKLTVMRKPPEWDDERMDQEIYAKELEVISLRHAIRILRKDTL